MSGALKDFKLAYTFKSLRQTCALEDFDTVWRARVEVYINATGEFSVCMYVCMYVSNHVCMFPIMYVCFQSCMYVLKHTYTISKLSVGV